MPTWTLSADLKRDIAVFLSTKSMSHRPPKWHARLGRQHPRLIGRFLRRLAYRPSSTSRIIGPSSVFSAAVPALFVVSASKDINILRNTPSILSTLQENVLSILVVLDCVETVTIPSHVASPIIHIQLRSPTPSASGSMKPVTPAPGDALLFYIPRVERLLQDIVDEAQA